MSIHRRTTKSGVRYDVRLRDPDGKVYNRTFATKNEAIDYQAAERADRARGVWVDPRGASTTFAEWAQTWLNADSTKRAKSRHTDAGIIRRELDRTLGPRSLGSITRLDVQVLVNDWKAKFAPSTVHRYYAVVQAIMTAAVDGDLIGRSPCRKIRLPQIMPVKRTMPTPEQIRDLAHAIGPQYAPMVYVGAILGLRFSECAAIHLEDVDFLRSLVHVRSGVVEAGGHLAEEAPKSPAGRRTMSAPTNLLTMLAAHIASRGLTAADGDQRLFTSPSGADLRYSNFRTRRWEPATKACGLDGLGFHDLRRSAATALVALGTDIRTVQERMGHSDPRLTLRLYAQATDDRDQEAADKLGDHFLGIDEDDEGRSATA